MRDGTWPIVSVRPGVSSQMTSKHTMRSAATSWPLMGGDPTVSAVELCGSCQNLFASGVR